MNQSIFLIRHDYFDNPVSGQEYIRNLVAENCSSEKLALIYDPMAEDFFSHVAKSDRDKFEQLISSYYGYWETYKNAMPLKWYQLDEISTFHITFLSPLVYELDDRFGGYLLGCLPLLNYEPNMYIYFRMSTYETEDIFLLIDGKEYVSVLEECINTFNDFVRDKRSDLKKMPKNSKSQKK